MHPKKKYESISVALGSAICIPEFLKKTWFSSITRNYWELDFDSVVKKRRIIFSLSLSN